MGKKRILLVEDEELDEFTKMLENDYEVIGRMSAEAALEVLQKGDIDLILCDLWMVPKDGMWLLSEVEKRGTGVPFVMITRYGTSANEAVKAMNAGAVDYISKPISKDHLLLRLSQTLERDRRDRTIRYLVQAQEEKHKIVYGTMQGVISEIEKVAQYNTTVLITGEPGTGKELVARAIHQNSPRREKPLIPVDCARISPEFLASDLFGHERGGFTGAIECRIGKFQLADGSTIFLDEIGDMTLDAQMKLLRFLQEREFERVGGTRVIKVDVRVIAATNQELNKKIDSGKFRRDLFDRLNVFPIHIPLLRERPEEIPLLTEYFIEKHCFDQKKAKKNITPEAMKLLKTYSWPGNVRELGNLMERLVIHVNSPTIQKDDILPVIEPKNNSEVQNVSISPIELGKRLKAARADIGLTQLDVAKELNLPRPAISQIESGRRKVDSIELKKLASLYKKAVSYFLEF